MAEPSAPLPAALDPAHPDYEPQDELAAALRQTKPLLWTAAAFSGAVNLLFLASPIYLIQIYNRVIPSGSVPTLIGLTIALLLALATMAVLDAARARILVRAAARIDRLLSARVLQAVIDNATRNGAGAKNAQMLRDLDQFRQALAGQAAQFFVDVPFMHRTGRIDRSRTREGLTPMKLDFSSFGNTGGGGAARATRRRCGGSTLCCIRPSSGRWTMPRA